MQGNGDTDQTPDGATADFGQSDAPGAGGVRRITSRALFAGANEVLVQHGSDQYRLRRTSKGKLILTK